MEMVDSFKHTTTIAFTNVERNPVLAVETFLFKMPEGVDVVGERGRARTFYFASCYNIPFIFLG